MSFVHPWIIVAGAAAATLPVIVHLLTRPRPVRMPLSTIRFVREAIQQRRAQHRLRDWIVLALCTLAVLLLALAIARPLLGPQPLVAEVQEGDAVRVVLLDLSQSMAATSGGIQAIERAAHGRGRLPALPAGPAGEPGFRGGRQRPANAGRVPAAAARSRAPRPVPHHDPARGAALPRVRRQPGREYGRAAVWRRTAARAGCPAPWKTPCWQPTTTARPAWF